MSLHAATGKECPGRLCATAHQTKKSMLLIGADKNTYEEENENVVLRDPLLRHHIYSHLPPLTTSNTAYPIVARVGIRISTTTFCGHADSLAVTLAVAARRKKPGVSRLGKNRRNRPQGRRTKASPGKCRLRRREKNTHSRQPPPLGRQAQRPPLQLSGITPRLKSWPR